MEETKDVRSEIEAAVRPELAKPETVTVGGKSVSILPLKRRWQSMFAQAALPLFRAELSATENIQKAIQDGTMDFVSLSAQLVDSELEADKELDRAAAVVLASQAPGAEADPEKFIKEQIAWLQDNSTTAELRELVEAQADKERLIQSVGERLPARFARSLNLAGKTDVTADSVKQLLTSYFAKLQARTGAGS